MQEGTFHKLGRNEKRLYGPKGIIVCGYPPDEQKSLAGALEKLGAYSRQVPMHDANPSTAHMFIVNPLAGGSLMSLFSTHPPLEKRIAKLRGVDTVRDDSGPSSSGGNAMDQGRAFWDRLSR